MRSSRALRRGVSPPARRADNRLLVGLRVSLRASPRPHRACRSARCSDIGSARIALARAVALERWHWTCVRFCACGYGTVLLAVFDQPVHLVNLPTLGFADLDGQIAHSGVADAIGRATCRERG